MTPLEGAASREAWSCRSVRELVERLHVLHPAVPLPAVDVAARAALIADPAEIETGRLRAEVAELRSRLADRDRELGTVRRERDYLRDLIADALAQDGVAA